MRTLSERVNSQLSIREQAIQAAMVAAYGSLTADEIGIVIMQARYMVYVSGSEERDAVGAMFLRDEFPELRRGFDRIDEAARVDKAEPMTPNGGN